MLLGREAVRLLQSSGMPYVFVTNGGGMTEHDKALSLSRLLDTEVTESMVLMSHTPFESRWRAMPTSASWC